MVHVVCTGDDCAIIEVQRVDGVYARLSARRLTSWPTPVFNSRAVASLCFDASVLRHTSALSRLAEVTVDVKMPLRSTGTKLLT